MSIQRYQEQFAWNANQGERLSFDISEASLMNTELVVMRPRAPFLSSKQNILDEEAVLRSQRSQFLSEPEIPNYEQSIMNDESYNCSNDEDEKVFELKETARPSNAVKRSTSSKIISVKQDSTLDFVSKIVQSVEYEKLSATQKKAVTVSVKGIYILYKHYVALEHLGKVKLCKHLKNMLVRRNFLIVKTRKAIVVRGILFNAEKLKLIFEQKFSLLVS